MFVTIFTSKAYQWNILRTSCHTGCNVLVALFNRRDNIIIASFFQIEAYYKYKSKIKNILFAISKFTRLVNSVDFGVRLVLCRSWYRISKGFLIIKLRFYKNCESYIHTANYFWTILASQHYYTGPLDSIHDNFSSCVV